MLRATLVAAVAVGTTACANEPRLPRASLPPMMMMGAPAALAGPEIANAEHDASLDLARKSMAAKVLSARALEIVTGLKPDPARLSEHD